ncbi:MAG: GTPase, partial [Candidatus Bathyarchaeota archaeon]|nr:GTPase [Candidatus Bathyarchaeota archaeon]
MGKINAIILGAAGRDFHNFNVYFKNNPKYRIVAFTAAQIPGIADRIFPEELSGPSYPKGIRIYPEEKLPQLIRNRNVEQVVFSYSDLSNEEIMHKASSVLANGANFLLLSPETTMLKSQKPVISICAVRTGAGKSTVARRVSSILREKGYDIVIVRHPMPYGNLRRQIVQRFE